MHESLLTEVVLRPLAAAFLDVGVYVAALVILFGWLRSRLGPQLDDVLRRRARWGPALGAALGVTPGCGGAILVMPLYARGKVSFGTVVAALTATMGDASWVVLAADPRLALSLHALLLVTGLVTGYAVDAVGWSPRSSRPSPADAPAQGCARGRTATPPQQRLAPAKVPALHAVGLPVAAFWLLTGAGVTVSVPVTFRLLDPSLLVLGPSVDTYLLVGLAGTALAAVVFVRGGCRMNDDDLETSTDHRLPQVLKHGAREASFITVWVGVAYLVWSLLENTAGLDPAALPLLGLTGVLVAAAVGLVPGCALQIVFTGLFLSGGVPFPAFAANAVAQDGDALLPLLALDRRAAAAAAVITTVPAVVVGSLLLLVL